MAAGRAVVYDLTVAGSHEFVANGIVVHNCDEVASWVYSETWDLLLLGLRLGSDPRVILTTTPKPRALVRTIIKRSNTVVTRGSTYDNLDNLPPDYADRVLSLYTGSRYERQEIFGELIEDVEGALWSLDQLDRLRVYSKPGSAVNLPESDLLRCVVGVDPAGGGADETGIVVAGKGVDGHGYVLADRSGQLHPEEWAKRAIAAFHEFKCDRIVVEKNFGGEMVEHTIASIDRNIPVRMVTASRGKIVRAEPIATLYKQERCHHVGAMAALEDQMSTFTQESGDSPDRMDALVWALTDVMEGSSASGYLAALADRPKPPGDLPRSWGLR